MGGTALGASGRSNNGLKLDVKTGKLSLWRLFPTFTFTFNSSDPINSTTGVVDITPPSTLNCSSYILQLCSNGTCFNATCPTTHCTVVNLTAGTTYNISAWCVGSDGGETPTDNTGTLTTPPTLELKTADATSPFTGNASATPSPNNKFVEVCAELF